MKNFKFKTLLLGLLLPYNQSMTVGEDESRYGKGMLNEIGVANVFIFGSFINSENTFIFKEWEQNNKSNSLKYNEKDLIFVIGATEKELEILSQNISDYYNNFNKKYIGEKKNIEIINILSKHKYEYYSVCNNKLVKKKICEQEELINIYEEIFTKNNMEKNFKEYFENKAGISKNATESIVRLLISFIPHYANSNLTGNYAYNITILNDYIEEKKIHILPVLNSKEPLYFVKINGKNQLVNEKPEKGEYQKFENNLSFNINFKCKK